MDHPCGPITFGDCWPFPATRRRKKRIFGVFEAFFTYRSRKTAFFGDFVRYCGVFGQRKRGRKRCRKITKALTRGRKRCRKMWLKRCLKTPQYLTKCRFCGVFAACISEKKKWKKHKNRLPCRWVIPFKCVGTITAFVNDGNGHSNSSVRYPVSSNNNNGLNNVAFCPPK